MAQEFTIVSTPYKDELLKIAMSDEPTQCFIILRDEHNMTSMRVKADIIITEFILYFGNVLFFQAEVCKQPSFTSMMGYITLYNRRGKCKVK